MRKQCDKSYLNAPRVGAPTNWSSEERKSVTLLLPLTRMHTHSHEGGRYLAALWALTHGGKKRKERKRERHHRQHLHWQHKWLALVSLKHLLSCSSQKYYATLFPNKRSRSPFSQRPTLPSSVIYLCQQSYRSGCGLSYRLQRNREVAKDIKWLWHPRHHL